MLEHLALRIRNYPNIVGLKVGDMEILICSYADDVILYIQNPRESVLPLLDLITCFVKLSGYTTNWTKSDFMSFSNVYTPGLHPFKIMDDHHTYHGLKAPKHPELIYNNIWWRLSQVLNKT